jgi:elongator complex protein 4
MSFKRKAVVISGNRPDSPPEARPSGSLHPTADSPSVTAQILQHIGVKPSIQTSHPAVSTGSESFDKLLGHGGLPLGSIVIVEESGTTDFASIILRGYISQGIVHARLKAPSKTVVIGASEQWGAELPGIYKDKKEAARQRVQEDESKISVSNLASSDNMKIAWRYAHSSGETAKPIKAQSKPDYITQFDFTSRLAPRPSAAEITYINERASLAPIVGKLELIVQQVAKSGSVVRVAIPSLLHPVAYNPPCSQPSELVPFLYCLRNLCRRYPNHLTIMISLSLALYPRETALIRWSELLCDGVIHLEAFPEEAVGDANKSQGLVHVYKLPVTTERGMMVARKGEHAFRVGRRQFEIHDWGIPVDEAEDDKKHDTEF